MEKKKKNDLNKLCVEIEWKRTMSRSLSHTATPKVRHYVLFYHGPPIPFLARSIGFDCPTPFDPLSFHAPSFYTKQSSDVQFNHETWPKISVYPSVFHRHYTLETTKCHRSIWILGIDSPFFMPVAACVSWSFRRPSLSRLFYPDLFVSLLLGVVWNANANRK